MDHIVGRLGEIARNIEIVGADPVTRHGFTQVPNVILADNRLSVGAKLAYAVSVCSRLRLRPLVDPRRIW